MRQRVDGQPAFVLHTYPFRETSLIVEAFTRDFGRIALVARGARRPRSAMRGLLMGFQPLELGWAGKGEVLTLMKAEWIGGQPLLGGLALFCGYYVNELLLHLLPREDGHERVFMAYAGLLQVLARYPEQKVQEIGLRKFEKSLLEELGYGLTLDVDSDGSPILVEGLYEYRQDQGAVLLEGRSRLGAVIHGKSLLDLARGELEDKRSLHEAKQLMRHLIHHQLNGVELESRKIFKELQEL